MSSSTRTVCSFSPDADSKAFSASAECFLKICASAGHEGWIGNIQKGSECSIVGSKRRQFAPLHLKKATNPIRSPAVRSIMRRMLEPRFIKPVGTHILCQHTPGNVQHNHNIHTTALYLTNFGTNLGTSQSDNNQEPAPDRLEREDIFRFVVISLA